MRLPILSSLTLRENALVSVWGDVLRHPCGNDGRSPSNLGSSATASVVAMPVFNWKFARFIEA